MHFWQNMMPCQGMVSSTMSLHMPVDTTGSERYVAGVGLMFAQMQEELEGTIVIMGTPAEETTGGKCVLVEEGAFDDVDFAFQLHLGAENNAHVVYTCHGLSRIHFPWKSSSCS